MDVQPWISTLQVQIGDVKFYVNLSVNQAANKNTCIYTKLRQAINEPHNF